MTEYELPIRYSVATSKQRRDVREQYAREQNNNCYWCGSSLNDIPPSHIRNIVLNLTLFPPGFLRHPIHLQHNHDTDMTEGAVHARCNGVMWQYHNR